MIIRPGLKKKRMSGYKGTRSCMPDDAHRIRKMRRRTKESFLKVRVNLGR